MCNLKAQTIVSRAVMSMASLFYPVTHPVILSLFISRVSLHVNFFWYPRTQKKKQEQKQKHLPRAGASSYTTFLNSF